MSGGVVQAPVKPVKLVGAFTTDNTGTWSGQVLSGLRYWVQPMTAGEFANSMTITGGTGTVKFRKFKPDGLGITLGTLLTVSAFETSPGPVEFNLFAAEDINLP